MAKLSLPTDAVQCNCGINVRQEEMILDKTPFEPNKSYLLCPKCKLVLFVVETDTSDKTQKPITTVTKIGPLDRRIFIQLPKETRNRPY